MSGTSGTEHFATICGRRMRYVKAGTGPPLVLVHGLLGYSFSWRFNMEALSPHRTVYALDMLGAGFSDRAPELACDFETVSARLTEFFHQLDLRDIDLLGTSHGGAIAMMAAVADARSQRRVRSLLLVDSINPWSNFGAELIWLFSSGFGGWFGRTLLPRLTFFHRIFLARQYYRIGRIAPGTLQGYQKPIKIAGTLDYGLGIVKCWHDDMKKLEAALPEIRHLPALVLWGDRDAAVDPRSAVQLRQCFDRAELVFLKDVGHLPYEEAPEDFNTAVIRFLTEFLPTAGGNVRQ